MDTKIIPKLDRKTALRIARRYVDKIETAGFPIIQAYLYGSYAKGKQRDFSDIDVALVSSTFSGKSFEDFQRIKNIKNQINIFLEPMPFTPENFQDWHPLVHEIKTTGIQIK